MTNPENDPFAVVAEFLDGERVDALALRDALATAEARDYLVDLLRLRQSVGDMGPMVMSNGARSRWLSPAQWAVAAAVLLCVSVGGYLLGQRVGLVAQLEGAGRIEVMADAPAPRAPKPTHVIRLEPGVNWETVKGR